MARWTALDFVTLARKELGNPTSDEISDTELLGYGNVETVQLVLGNPVAFPELITSTPVTTTAGDQEYELAVSDVIELLHLFDTTNSLRLKSLGGEWEWHKKNQGSWSNQQPYRWLERGAGANGRTQVAVWPPPPAGIVITVTYRQEPTAMVLSPSPTSPAVKLKWDKAILDRLVKAALPIVRDRKEARQQALLAGEAELRAGGVGIVRGATIHRPGSRLGDRFQ